MKIFTKNSIAQKILIIITTIIVLSVSIPKPVHADIGGRLASPIFTLVAAVVDVGQHLLEWTMLGNMDLLSDDDNFMKNLEGNSIDASSIPRGTKEYNR